MKTNTPPARRAAHAPAAEPQLQVGTGLAALIYFALALLYFLPAFLPGRQIFGTDYLAGSYVFYHFISERLASGALPKWVPYVFGGLPLFANPGSTFHPVHFLAELLLPTSRVLPAVFTVQFALGGLGMFLLARELGARAWVALVAGLAFEFTGITMSWVYAGHDGRIIVVTLAPLFLFFLHRGIRTGRLAPFAGAAATLATALLSFQIQNAYYLLLAGLIWAVFSLWHTGVARRPAALGKTLALGLGSVAFAFAIAAVNFLPFQDYVSESPRGAEEGGRGYEYSTSYSMPPADVLGMAVPEQVGASVQNPETGEALFPPYQGPNAFKLHSEYVGALVLVLLVVGFGYARRRTEPRDGRAGLLGYWWFFLGLALFALSMAFGGHTPLYRRYYAVLPGLNRFRAPDLAYYVAALSLVAMAALTLERLARLREEAHSRSAGRAAAAERAEGPLPWLLGGVVGVALLGAMVGGAPAGWFRFALFAGLVGGVVWGWMRDRLPARTAALLLAVLTVLDLGIIARRFFHTYAPPEVVFAADDVVGFLQAQPQPNRVWVLPVGQPYHGGGNYLMHFGIDQAGGEHPNILHRYNQFAGAGPGTLPDWHNLAQFPGFLAAANVRYLISTEPIQAPWLREVYRGSALVYENTLALPRAYLVPRSQPVAEGQALAAMQAPGFDPRHMAFVEGPSAPALPAWPLQGAAEVTLYTPDEVRVRTRADRDALLVLADNYYEGWEVAIDGRPARLLRANHSFRGVVVPRGQHEVRFVFRPRELYLGLWVYLGGSALLLGYGAFLLLRRRRGAAATSA